MVKKIRLLNITSSHGLEGADHLALSIAHGLQQKGHLIFWLCPKNSKTYVRALAYGFTVFPLDKLMPKDLISLSQKHKIDVINTHHSQARRFTLKAKFRGLKTKLVWTRHCINRSIHFLGGFHTNYFIDKQIAVSSAVKKSLLLSGVFFNKVALVHPGIDLEKFYPQDALQKTQSNCAQLGVVARFSPGKKFKIAGQQKKGHDFLFKALQDVKTPYHCHIVGVDSEDAMEKLRELIQFYGLDLSRFSLYPFQKDILPFYHQFDINILPSQREGFGLVITEAMASGVPCIALKSGGVQEIITHDVSGLLVNPNSVADFSYQINRLIQDSELRKRLSQQGLKAVINQFSIEIAVNKTEAVLLSLDGFVDEL